MARRETSVPGVLLLILLVATTLAGITTAAWGSNLQTVVWTSQQDFEGNAATTGTPTTRLNIDTASLPGDARIGVSKDFVTAATISLNSGTKVYTTGIDRASIAVINTATKAVTATIALPAKAAGVVYNSVNNKLYVGQYNTNQVLVIDCGTDAIIHTLTVGSGAYAAAYNPTDNKVYISNTGDQTVTVVDGASDTTVGTLAVVAGATTAAFDPALDRVYFTSKANQYMTIIDGASDQVVQNVAIEPVVNLLGGQSAGNVGLRIDALAKGISSANTLHLSWNYDTLNSSQNIQFQLRTAPDVASLDTATYKGPDGTADTWYDLSTSGAVTVTETDATVTTSLVLSTPYAPAAEIQVKLSSDGLTTPVLHAVTIGYERYPDMVVSNVEASPSIVTIGSPVTLSSTVQNLGPGAAEASTVGFYLVGNGNSYLLGTAATPALDAEQSAPGNATITMPSVPPGSYTVQACADYLGGVAESNEANNCALGNTVTFTYPDLVMTSISGPATATIGTNISLSSAVKNQGGMPAGSFNVGLYLTRNGVDTFLGERTVTSLAVGQTSSASTTVTVAAMPTGDYTLKACADYTNQITESNEADNCTLGGTVSIYSVEPDLVVTSISGTVTGGQLSYSVTMKNQGTTTATGYTRIGIYLSTDATIDPATDTFIDYTDTVSLTGGASVTRSGNYPVPKNMTGTYYVGAVADYNGNIPEYDETNNAKAGNQVSIANDLVVTAVSGTVTNGYLNYSVTVKNIGNGYTGYNRTGIYLSTDNAITTADSLITYNDSAGIMGGSSQTYTYSWPVPKNMIGPYYVGAIADYYQGVAESDESNNAKAGNQVSIANDLVVTAVSGTVTNGYLNYSVTVKNMGNGCTGYNRTGIYLSTDNAITTTDSLLNYNDSAGIMGGSSETFTYSWPVPKNMTGTYYVGAIADYYQGVTESDESNNAMAGNQVSIANDLIVTAVSGTVTNGYLNYSVTVKNIGNGYTGYNRTGIYLSTDNNITTSDSFITYNDNAGIMGGSSQTYTYSWALPQTMHGTYYVGAIADYYAGIAESDENNNALAGTQVTF